MKKDLFHNKRKKNQKGFVAADFIFSFTLVIGCGVLIFALTFSLMTVEVAQYITWSAARSFSAANSNPGLQSTAASTKFNNLSKNFPLLTDESNNWFSLILGGTGLNATTNSDGSQAGIKVTDPTNSMGGQTRQPWVGVSSQLHLKLFQSINLPFLGKITNNPETFKFALHAFMLRNPSREECITFMKDRYANGILQIDDLKDAPVTPNSAAAYIASEDNGC